MVFRSKFLDFPMSKIAQSLEHAQISVVIYRDFRKKTVYRLKHILNHLSLQIAQVL